jgi:hypothetical protein
MFNYHQDFFVIESVRGATRKCQSVAEYLAKIQQQLTGSSKAFARTIIKKIVTKNYDDSRIREYILKMTNFANNIKRFDMKIKNDFVIHLILVSLPKEFETFTTWV